MDILFVAIWSAPNSINANSASSGVHIELAKRNLNIGVLCSYYGHDISEAENSVKEIENKKVIELNSSPVKYILPTLPAGWTSRHISEQNWQKAVNWGIQLLKHYRPKALHLQQWQSFWWMAEAAKCCGIPYNYTPYDFGLVCGRTVLIKNDGEICRGNVEQITCANCIYNGRGWVGKMNEKLVEFGFISRAIKFIADYFPDLKLYERGLVTEPVQQRIRNERNRLHNMLGGLDNLFVNSVFSKNLFSQFGVINNVITIPWFHSLKLPEVAEKKQIRVNTIGFIGRVSPEKGLDVLLHAVHILNRKFNLNLSIVVAGDTNNHFAKQLQRDWAFLNIEWLNWVDKETLTKVYNDIDLLVVPSTSFDNGPITIMEAIATKTPVIVSDNETLTTYLKTIKIEHTFKSGSPKALANLISKYINKPQMLKQYASQMPPPMTVETYVDQLLESYKNSD